MHWQDCYTASEIEQLVAVRRTRGFGDDDAGWEFLSDLVQRLLHDGAAAPFRSPLRPPVAPAQVFNYWDEVQPPDDVDACMESWRCSGPHLVRYDRAAADDFLSAEFGGDVLAAFRYAHHPAMQADLFRLGRLLRLGGLYVDADDAYLGPDPTPITFRAGVALKPLAVCRQCPASVPVAPAPGRDALHWYYVNNAPIAGVAGHPLFAAALERAVAAVMARKARGELANIHGDTGPTNFSLALLEHVVDCFARDADCDVWLGTHWPFLEQSRWLDYKHTGRNWRSNAVIYPPACLEKAPDFIDLRAASH